MKITILGPEYMGDPEALCMLQAFYSRSFMPIEDRVAELGGDLTSVKNSLKRVYIGYGHDSVGDLGDVVVFIEGCSILAAKVIQNNPLYNGQESSTRYLDFKTMGTYVPSLGSDTSLSIYALQTMGLGLYEIAVNEVIESLTTEKREQLDQLSAEDRVIADKAIRARAFDICRSLLPAGCKTNLSWKTSLRKANELTASLLAHPLAEVRELASALRIELRSKFPNAISEEPRFTTTTSSGRHAEFYVSRGDQQELDRAFLDMYDTADITALKNDTVAMIDVLHHDVVTLEGLNVLRQRYEPVSRQVAHGLLCRFNVLMDYGSYRDVQRHRNGYMTFPVLTTRYGFHGWYMQHLLLRTSTETFESIEGYLARVRRLVENDDQQIGEYDLQYAIPLGFRVAFRTVWALDQMLYFAELRSGETVHPTVRPFAQTVGMVIKHRASNMPLFVNWNDDPGVSFRRGGQDIVFL